MTRQNDIKNLIRSHSRRLQKLKEQQAAYGLETSPQILIEIEDIEVELKQLQSDLDNPDSSSDSIIRALHQLPMPPVDFTGRIKEQEDLHSAWKELGVARIGFFGMPGVGKTTLALQFAARLAQEHYQDAQFYLDLKGTSQQPLTSVEAMAHVIRSYYPMTKLPETERELRAQYHSVLHDKQALLLMDNAAGLSQIESLIPPKDCALLVTSRRRFILPGSFVVDLDTLPPQEAQDFMFSITDRVGDQADEIARLCAHLPLALRLAASTLAERVDLSPMDYVRRLRETKKRLKFLKNIVSSLTLSFELLSSEMQTYWAMLSVFCGSFDRSAAASIWNIDTDDAHDLLSDLLRNSLLEWNSNVQRYHLHDLTRLFAQHRLEISDVGVARQRHAQYYLSLAKQQAPLFATEQERRALIELYSIHSDLLEAQRFLIESDASQGLEFFFEFQKVLEQYYRRRGFLDESSELLMASIEKLRAANIEPKKLGQFEIQLADIYRRQLGDLDRALAYYQQGLDRLFPEMVSLDASAGKIYRRLGDIYRIRGEFQKALRKYDEAEKLLDGEVNASQRGKLLSSMVDAYIRLGTDLDRAVVIGHKSLQLHQKSKDQYEIAQSHRMLADVYLTQGQIVDATSHITVAQNLLEDVGYSDSPIMGWVLRTQGDTYRLKEDRESALRCYEDALKVFEKRSVGVGIAIIHEKLGTLNLELGQAEMAIDHLQEALKMIRSASGAQYALATILLSRVKAEFILERSEDYKSHLDELIELVQEDDFNVIRGQLIALMRSNILIGVATSVSADKGFDTLDTLAYSSTHNFKLVQVYLNNSVISTPALHQQIIDKAANSDIQLLCHAPDRLRAGEAVDPRVNQAVLDILRNNPNKWVVHHFDQQQSVDETLELVERLIKDGLIPCIENFHYLDGAEKGRQHYRHYLELFRKIREHNLRAYAVIDIPRLFHTKLELTVDEASNILLDVFKQLDNLKVPIILHLVDSTNLNQEREYWCPLGEGAIPYDELLKIVFASTCQIEAVIYEYEDKRNPLISHDFLRECISAGVDVYRSALSVHWWG